MICETGGCLNAEFPLYTFQGDESWVVWTISALWDEKSGVSEFQIVGRDESRRHQAETELRHYREGLEKLVRQKTKRLQETNKQMEANLETQRRIAEQNTLLANVIEQSEDMVIATNLNGEIIFANQAYYTSHPALSGSSSGENIHRQIIEQIKTKENWSGVLRCPLTNETEMLLDCSIFPISDPDGNVISMACSQRDITNKSQLEAQLRQAQKMEAIGTLAGGIAHDFNNLLMSISGFAKLARKKVPDSPETKKIIKYIDNIMMAGSRGSELVKQLLKFGRPDEILGLQRDDHIMLETLIEEVSSLLMATLPSTIIFHKNYHAHGFIHINSGQIHQVLINLCTNASHAMNGDGHLYLSVDEHSFDNEQYAAKNLPNPGSYACIRVRDTGCGISPENCQRIFDPFFTTKAVGEGSGMGLAVAHGIIKDHQGSMLVESTLGEGTEFFVYLPQDSGDEQD